MLLPSQVAIPFTVPPINTIAFQICPRTHIRTTQPIRPKECSLATISVLLWGPIVKNKLFFFNNTEWIRVRSNAPLEYTIIDPDSVATLASASQAYFASKG
jgi:hypothetical protein